VAEVVLFHHALGLTSGIVAFADVLRAAGHTVHTPDLFEGRTFDSIEAGVGYAQEIGRRPRRHSTGEAENRRGYCGGVRWLLQSAPTSGEQCLRQYL
jgi:dienelactone hydrolase